MFFLYDAGCNIVTEPNHINVFMNDIESKMKKFYPEVLTKRRMAVLYMGSHLKWVIKDINPKFLFIISSLSYLLFFHFDVFVPK